MLLLYNVLVFMISSHLINEVRGNTLAFVVDNTFSMRNNIAKVKNTITQIVDTYSDFMFIEKYVFVKFNEVELLTRSNIFENRFSFDTELNSIFGTDVNLDCPEPALFGVLQALKLSNGTKMTIFVFTDAPAKDYYRQREVTRLCQDAGSQITFVLTGHCLSDPKEFWMYKSIARTCSGDVIVLSASELDQVPKYLGETIKHSRKVLKRTKTQADLVSAVYFTVKHETKYLIITLSGKNVQLSSLAKSKTRIIWTDDFKAIKIIYPSYGNHDVMVSGENIDIDVSVFAIYRDVTTTSKPLPETTSIPTTELLSIQLTDDMKAPVVEISEGYKIEVPRGNSRLVSCQVMGKPKPVIKWMYDNTTTLPSLTITLETENLYMSFLSIKKVQEHTFYSCTAENVLGSDIRYIEVAVKDEPLFVYNNIEGENLKSKNYLENNIFNKPSEGTKIDFTNSTYETELFKVREANQTVDWCKTEKISCSKDSRTYAKYEWLYNDNIVNQSGNSLEISETGNYTCRATNEDESLKINFFVAIISCCIIDIGKSVNRYTPFILHDNETFTQKTFLSNNLILPTNETLQLMCHNPHMKSSPFSKDYITITCVNANRFKSNDILYKWEEMICINEVYPVIKTIDLSYLVQSKHVGFIWENEFKTIYNVLVNSNRNGHKLAYYIPMKTRTDNFNEIEWFKHPEALDAFPVIYTCVDNSSICCYAKRQLVSASDVAYGAAQTSTFVDNLNSVPFWRTCNGSSQESINNFDESLRSMYNNYTKVWSGAGEYVLDRNSPKFLWKLFRLNSAEEFSYIYINQEDIKSYSLNCIKNSYTNLVPDELKGRIHVCNTTELFQITKTLVSSYDGY